MEIVRYSNSDYKEVCTWWKSHGWPNIPETSLSSTGFLVKDENVSILAGWVYDTNSDIALLEFIVANPAIRGDKREEAFDLFFNVVLEYIKIKKYRNVFTSVQHKNLMNRLEKFDFKKTDENMTNFIRSL